MPGRPVARRAAAALQAAAESPPQYLTFVLGGEMFAIGILNVKEVIDYGHLTGIPMMPAFIRADFMHGMGKVAGRFVILLNTSIFLPLGYVRADLLAYARELSPPCRCLRYILTAYQSNTIPLAHH
ncbi:chemotaxis protein CheW [Candidatus Accumulibacter phosphatis]|uniref:Chemotaxis protein CheW n=1 Tax=Candidatus Accumulibacter contiguus TaxID=2954381 RepID=A0ABX1TD90_9PROT|nr:chemotaxis protein CheW [Candidatus Accumulibacter contiguus]